jgi:HAMP domain-containing protein
MNPLLAVRKSLTLKVSLVLSMVVVLLTAVAGYVITAREVAAMEELTLSKAKLGATIGARSYAATLEDAIDNGYVAANDLFDHTRQEIKGYDWGNKPRYHSKYDFYTDAKVLVMQDKFLETEDFLYAFGVDSTGYLPTNNSHYQQRLTGDANKDVQSNRTKRIFNSEAELKAATSKEPILVQSLVRDNGTHTWDVSSPIEVKGKHWGAFRIGVVVDQIEKKKQQLFFTLMFVFAIFGLVTVGTISFLVRGAMQPLQKLTALADEISVGEHIDEVIKPGSIDEVGRMAKSLDRLRASLKAAMARLGE